MANKTNCVINGIPYYRIRQKVGMKFSKEGELVPDIKPFYGKNKTDAENKLKDYIKKMSLGKNGDEYFKDIANYYVYSVFIHDSRYASGTRELYERSYRLYISQSTLSSKKINEIGSKDVQDVFIFLKDKEINLKKGGTKKIGQGSLKAAKNLLVLFFTYAEIEGYCKNPMANVTVPKIENGKAPNNEVTVFNDKEINKIVFGIGNDRLRFLYLLAIGTGIREGELLILRYSDFTDEGVSVTSQLVTRNKIVSENRFNEEDTKTRNSVRVVPLPQNLRAAFERHKSEHQKEMELRGYETDFVFTTKDGNHIDRRNLRRAHGGTLKRIGVKYKKFHAFRATYATMLCKRGVPIQRTAELMGDDIKTVSRYYVFVTSKEKQDAADTLNDIFYDKNENQDE